MATTETQSVPALELKGISKEFGSSRILRGVDLSVPKGQFLVLVGPSGCGKSTLLRIVAGLDEPTSGEILIDGKRMNEREPKDRHIGMVFQSYALYPHMSVFDNMAFGLRVRKRCDESEITKRVHEAAELLQLSGHLERKPRQLSGGQRQRVALGRAIVRKPKIFLFDEPLSNLDAHLRTQMRVELKRLHHLLGNTMVYVTHDQVEATTMGDRIAILDQGVLQQVDSPVDVYQKPANRFVAGFVGVPEMNFLEGKLESSGQFAFSGGRLQLGARSGIQPGAETVLGIRPEFLSIGREERAGAAQLQGRIEVIENMGAHNLVHVRVGDRSLRVLSPNSDSLSPRQDVLVRFDLTHAHLFDRATGASLS